MLPERGVETNLKNKINTKSLESLFLSALPAAGKTSELRSRKKDGRKLMDEQL